MSEARYTAALAISSASPGRSPQPGVGQEPDNLGLAIDRGAQRRTLAVAQITAIGMLAFRQPHALTRVPRYAPILNRRAEHLAQQPERILDGRGANAYWSARPSSSAGNVYVTDYGNDRVLKVPSQRLRLPTAPLHRC